MWHYFWMFSVDMYRSHQGCSFWKVEHTFTQEFTWSSALPIASESKGRELEPCLAQLHAHEWLCACHWAPLSFQNNTYLAGLQSAQTHSLAMSIPDWCPRKRKIMISSWKNSGFLVYNEFAYIVSNSNYSSLYFVSFVKIISQAQGDFPPPI